MNPIITIRIDSWIAVAFWMLAYIIYCRTPYEIWNYVPLLIECIFICLRNFDIRHMGTFAINCIKMIRDGEKEKHACTTGCASLIAKTIFCMLNRTLWAFYKSAASDGLGFAFVRARVRWTRRTARTHTHSHALKHRTCTECVLSIRQDSAHMRSTNMGQSEFNAEP